MRLFTISIIAILLSSCAFNKSFYQPNTNSVLLPNIAESHYINYGSNDSIQGFFYKQKKPIASIFILHGNAGNLESWSEIADLFWQVNYQVFIIDYPGYGNSSNTPSHKATLLSTQKAVDYFIELPNVKDTKKLIMGFSLGGNLAIKMGHDNPTVFDAMLIEGAFESHKAIAVNNISSPFKFAPYLLVKNTIKGKKLIASWDKPLLIIHSTDDATCPYKMGKSLFDSAKGTKLKELWTIKGPHLSGISRNFELYMAKTRSLLSDTIPFEN